MTTAANSTTSRLLPAHLHAAYAWTKSAGEQDELTTLEGDALAAYERESAANARAHGENDVNEGDLRELRDWLREPPEFRAAERLDLSVDAVAERLGMSPDDEINDASGIDWGYTQGPADGAPVFLADGWTADDGNAEVEYPLASSGREAAELYVDGGDWGEQTQTDWVRVSAWQAAVSVDAGGQVIYGRTAGESHKIEIEPIEPACLDDAGHDWHSDVHVVGGISENPGVWGHGAGVIIREHCAHCGRYRVTDTYAQDRSTGEQGLTSVRYEDADDTSMAYVRDREDE